MSAVFDGADMLQHDNVTGYGLTNQFTMSGWVKCSTVNNNQAYCSLLTIDAGTEYYYARHGASAEKSELVWLGDDTTEILYATSVATTGWQQFVIRQKASVDPEMWLDGTSISTNIGGPAGSINFADFGKVNIGAFYTGEQNLTGSIADVAIWNVALSDGEVTTLQTGTTQPPDVNSNLIAWWPLYDDLTDWSGNGKDQTNKDGTVTFSTVDHPVDPPGTIIQPVMNYYMNMMRG